MELLPRRRIYLWHSNAVTVFIDRPLWPARGRLWSHLVSDTSFTELHDFAARLGMPPRAFERDHYDVPAELYEPALRLGAEPIGSQELVARLSRAGLRRRKHLRGA
jgi:Protein of unknown function (DUF4031)